MFITMSQQHCWQALRITIHWSCSFYFHVKSYNERVNFSGSAASSSTTVGEINMYEGRQVET
jgi:hypothetical protein